jgi:hypothetical protein
VKRSKFDAWFEAQYGGLPNSDDLLRWDAKYHELKEQAAEAERRRDRLAFLGQCYTAALYARNAFTRRKP